MRVDGEVGLGGMVVMMMGAPDITAEAGMCSLSWSVLGLDGSSEDTSRGIQLEGEKTSSALGQVTDY